LVTWAVASLAADSSTSVQLVVTATQTITNDDYRATADGNLSAVGEAPAVTYVGQLATKYYYFGSTRVAMHKGGVLYYLHGDHLGSTSLTTDASGGIVAQARYLPYGQERWITGTLTTDFGFTGQRSDNYTHLIEMGTRWYDPQLNRWISPDSIVPQPGDPQNLNRFSYVLDNPVRHRDPSGHCIPEVNCPGDRKQTQSSDVTVTKRVLGYYDPDLPAETAAIVSGAGLPLSYATSFYTLGKSPGAWPRDPIDYMPRTITKFGRAATLALPIYNGYINDRDIGARQRFGMISDDEATKERLINGGYTLGNTAISISMLRLGTPTFVVGAAPPVAAIVSNPATVFIAVPSASIVAAWEQQSFNNMAEGMPWEQAWKSARDTTYEPVLNFLGFTRQAHPEWYWYPRGH
jgi:RHS repeat-associated protein